MNLIFSRLSLTNHLLVCPVFSGFSTIAIVDSFFCRFFGGVFRGDNKFSVGNSAFITFLDHPISFVSCNSRIKSPNELVNVKDSKFCKCSSIEPGGAIYVTYPGATVNITSCGFYDCSSTGSEPVAFIDNSMKAGGGGCALLCSKFYVSLCCFSNCYSVERGPALFTASNGYDDAVFNLSVIIRASEGICPIHFGRGRDVMSNINTTMNTCYFVPGGAFTYSGIRNLLQYTNIMHCVSTHSSLGYLSRIFDFAVGSAEETCRMCNVVNNSNMYNIKCVFYSYHNQITFTNFVFYQNDSPLFAKGSGSLIIENCHYDTSEIGSATLLAGNSLGFSIQTNYLSIPDACKLYAITNQAIYNFRGFYIHFFTLINI